MGGGSRALRAACARARRGRAPLLRLLGGSAGCALTHHKHARRDTPRAPQAVCRSPPAPLRLSLAVGQSCACSARPGVPPPPLRALRLWRAREVQGPRDWLGAREESKETERQRGRGREAGTEGQTAVRCPRLFLPPLAAAAVATRVHREPQGDLRTTRAPAAAAAAAAGSALYHTAPRPYASARGP